MKTLYKSLWKTGSFPLMSFSFAAMKAWGGTLILCLCLLLCAWGSIVEANLPDPDQWYLLTTNVEGNYQNNNEEQLSRRQYKRSGISKISEKRPSEECAFENPIDCDSDPKYKHIRTYDGSCNNLQHPYWGKARTPLARFLKSDYDDGTGSPRLLGKDGDALPNPRDIRLSIHEKSLPIHELKNHSLFLMQWGQRTSHDMLLKVESKALNGEDLDCCGEDSGKENCEIPILVRSDDPYYSQYKRTCLNFRRSKASADLKCTFGTRQQLSNVTSFIDASDLYGSNDVTNANLRTKVDGLLKTQMRSDGSELMPAVEVNFCRSPLEKKCFQAGDFRANQHPALMSLQTILLREHNYLARKLKFQNPEWNDEKLFQESRRIVIAEIQHITFSSFLPNILGSKIMNFFDLYPRPIEEYFTGYDDRVIPTSRNSFMAAAFRFGHSLVNDHLAFKDCAGNKERTLFRHLWGNPDKLYEANGIEKTLRGLQEEHSQSVDRYKSEEMINRFFESPDQAGTDVISMNINRGRDHGIAGYMEWRKMCKLSTADQFSSLTDHTPEMVKLLQSQYRHPSDIDLFVGGVTETPLPEALVGPTFACIIGLQFKALKYGDRFYYENSQPEVRLTITQLKEIKKTTLAGVVCRNTNIGEIQKDVFSHGSPLIDCDEIQDDIDFTLWKEVQND